MPLGRKVFVAVVLSQLITIALILGWYFYTLRSELGSLTKQRAQEAVLQSIAATEDYFKPAEMVVEAGQLLLSDHILGPDKPDSLERYFFGQLRLRPLLAGLYVGNSAGEFFYVMRSNEKVEGGTRTKVIRNGPRGREVELTWRRPDYAIVKSEQDPRIPMIRERATGIAPRLNGAVALDRALHLLHLTQTRDHARLCHYRERRCD